MNQVVWLYVFWISVGMFAYIQFVYAIIVMILGGRGRGPSTSGELPNVTLVVPAHNEEKLLEAKLENALAIDYPRDQVEIIVASDGSVDRTNAIAEGFADRGVKLLAFTARRGKASVVNDAISAASNDVICLCDANVMFRPDALKRMVTRFGDEKVGAVTGDVRLASEDSNFGEGEAFYYLLEKRLQEAESNIGSLMGVDGGMYVIRRSLFKPLPADTILDDFVISIQVLKQGHRVVYEAAAIADENGTPEARQEYRRRVRVAAGSVQSLKRGDWPPVSRVVEFWQYLSHKPLRWLSPLWLTAILVANIAIVSAGSAHWFYQLFLGIQVFCYALALLGLVSLPFRSTRVGAIPFYFVLSHVAMTVGTVKGLLNRQKVTWQQAERTGVAGQQAGQGQKGQAGSKY